ncbi:MAG: hypothetical protein KA235_01575 [Prevotella sp.]|jgi:hypothetical protein|nr:hypothetical protein [Prevotella sp.]
MELNEKEKQDLAADLNTMATSIEELDRGLVSVMVQLNALSNVLVKSGVINGEELMAAIKSEFEALSQASEEALKAYNDQAEAVAQAEVKQEA